MPTQAATPLCPIDRVEHQLRHVAVRVERGNDGHVRTACGSHRSEEHAVAVFFLCRGHGAVIADVDSVNRVEANDLGHQPRMLGPRIIGNGVAFEVEELRNPRSGTVRANALLSRNIPTTATRRSDTVNSSVVGYTELILTERYHGNTSIRRHACRWMLRGSNRLALEVAKCLPTKRRHEVKMRRWIKAKAWIHTLTHKLMDNKVA